MRALYEGVMVSRQKNTNYFTLNLDKIISKEESQLRTQGNSYTECIISSIWDQAWRILEEWQHEAKKYSTEKTEEVKCVMRLEDVSETEGACVQKCGQVRALLYVAETRAITKSQKARLDTK